MVEAEQVPILLSSGVRALLAENEVDLPQLLRNEGLDIKAGIAADGNGALGEKDVALILIASAAVIAAATPIITRLIETLGNQPIIVRKKNSSNSCHKEWQARYKVGRRNKSPYANQSKAEAKKRIYPVSVCKLA